MTPAQPAQLPLGFEWRPAFGRDDFLVAPANARALATLENWRQWPDPVLLLAGPEGAGKSHLAQLWCRAVSARFATPLEHNFKELSSLIAGGPVALEDADQIRDESLVFHAINAARESGHALLLTARMAPPVWQPALPDLASRLQALNKAVLEAPDEALLSALVIKLMADRQMVAEPRIVEAIVARIDRSFAAARDAVVRLDAASLAVRRPLSVALIKAVLAPEADEP